MSATPRTDGLWRELMGACKSSGIAPSRCEAFGALDQFRQFESELEETKQVLNERLIDRDKTILSEGVKRADAERRLSALSGKKERVVIEVSGGLVTAIHLSDPFIEVAQFDWDNIKCDHEMAQRHQEELYNEAIKKTPHTISL